MTAMDHGTAANFRAMYNLGPEEPVPDFLQQAYDRAYELGKRARQGGRVSFTLNELAILAMYAERIQELREVTGLAKYAKVCVSGDGKNIQLGQKVFARIDGQWGEGRLLAITGEPGDEKLKIQPDLETDSTRKFRLVPKKWVRVEDPEAVPTDKQPAGAA